MTGQHAVLESVEDTPGSRYPLYAEHAGLVGTDAVTQREDIR